MRVEQMASQYNPRDHLVTITTKQGPKEYYPAAWRLYELNLRFENANFSSEILFMDMERDRVGVKCRLYLGPDFEMASRKTEAMKSGRLSELDKVETAAKARCARDLGVSTELALEIEDTYMEDDTPPATGHQATSSNVEQKPVVPTTKQHSMNRKKDDQRTKRLNEVFLLAKRNGYLDSVKNNPDTQVQAQAFIDWCNTILEHPVSAENMTLLDLSEVEVYIKSSATKSSTAA